MSHEQKSAPPLTSNRGEMLPAVRAAGGSIARLIAAIMPVSWAKQTAALNDRTDKLPSKS